MANVKHLKMAQTVISRSDIEVKNGFLGLSYTCIFKPTGSRLKVLQLELSPADGPKVRSLFGLAGSSLAAQVSKLGKFQPVPNGNYSLDLCYATDRQFAALQLFQFKHLDYEPVTDVFFLEGQEAATLLSLFL